MNKTTGFLIAASLMIAANYPAAALPSDSPGEVTMAWQKFDDIWKHMQDLEKKVGELEKPVVKPPVPFTITKAAYKGNVMASKIAMTAAFEIDVYEAKEWVKIPFLPSSIAITEARLDGEPVGIVQEDGTHQLVMKKPGRHVLRVMFALRAPKPEEAPQLQFNIQATPMTVIALDFPQPKLDVRIDPAQGVETTAVGNNHTLVTAALPPTSGIYVHWQKAASEDVAGPTKLYLDSQQLLTVSEGTLKSRWNLHYSILHKGMREIQVGVPADWNILSVNGEGLQEWKVVSGKNGPELAIQLAYARRGELNLSIEAEKGMGDASGVIEVPRLNEIQVEREQGTVGIEAKGAVEIQVQNRQGLHLIDPKELPNTLWQSATQPILFAFRYTQPYALALSLTRRPEVAVLSTTIDAANGITVLTPRGQMITKVSYQVRNQLKQYLEIRLPKDSALWSAFVAGEPVKPTLTEKGSYRIPLAKSQLGDGGQQGFPVELIFYQNVPKFMPLGYRAMALPMPDAPVSRMLWSLYLPEKYRFPYFGGDVEKGAMAQAWNMREIDSSERESNFPAAAPAQALKSKAFKKDLQMLAGYMGTRSGSAGKVDGLVARQEEVASSLFVDKENGAVVSGVLPVAFAIPTSGHMFNFGQVMIVDQNPSVSLFYLHANILRGLLILALAGLGLFLYRKRHHLAIQLFQIVRVNVERLRLAMPRRPQTSN